ncbi:hypothetical protein RND71_041856 [Anisodus tanguticus]|uniref:Uncharacterized protein n=1 Tax=Anisodus tanguticus TaxID=243964 RepID=A0AAE1QUX7_9SOLA|nr:hypothetical protein RND71_041856 [Anisodus tanguticus]
MAELLSMAMALDDDDMKDDDVSVSPLDLSSIGNNVSGDVPPSPEDIAWADSCLINDLAISDHDRDSLKHASPNTFTIFSAVMRDDSPQESHIFSTIEETGISGILDDIIYDVSPTNGQEGNTTRHQINNKDFYRDSLKHVLPNTFTIFSAVMRDDSPQESHIFSTIEETGISGILDDTIYDVSPTNGQEGNTTRHQINNKDTDNLENLDEYIFKVWEFDIPDEEDELVKQFNKALAGSSPDSTSSASENLGVVLDDKLLDDIISGLDDLSLSPSNN